MDKDLTEFDAGQFLTYPIRSDKLTMTVKVSGRVADHRSEFQRIEIVDTEVFGRMLLLDGHVQLAEFDEHAYHEALVHVPLLSMESPRRALIVGGGDGGVARELARDPRIEHVDMVEIDRAVVDLCREHMPGLHAGGLDDPRVKVHIADAFEFVKAATEPYDLIVADSTDVYEDEEGELSARLFTDAFYRDLLRLLTPTGFVVTQADNPVFCPYSLADVLESFGRVFPSTGSYQALVPSFGGVSAFVWGSQGPSISRDWPQGRETGPFSYLRPATWQLAMDPPEWS